ncbi:MAG: sigma-70 family RNA polymerase sigma factor [Phycisphaerae bacterium]|nr:sigma-70 family RNA polymerase sigma factor [Phycisphaerae bacterium]
MDNNSEKKTNKQQFLKLFLQHQKRIYYYILMLVPNISDADDIMQQTAEVMWNKFTQFQQDSNFVAWASQIALYKIKHFKRSKARSVVCFIDEMADIAQQNAIDPQKEENMIILKDCLRQLNEKDMNIVKLRYEEDMSIKKVAECVSRPVQGMYKAMTRIHNKLVECVDRQVSKRKNEIG